MNQTSIVIKKKKLSVFGMVDKCKEMVYYYSKEQDRKFRLGTLVTVMLMDD
jgi:hypothetical protein